MPQPARPRAHAAGEPEGARGRRQRDQPRDPGGLPRRAGHRLRDARPTAPSALSAMHAAARVGEPFDARRARRPDAGHGRRSSVAQAIGMAPALRGAAPGDAHLRPPDRRADGARRRHRPTTCTKPVRRARAAGDASPRPWAPSADGAQPAVPAPRARSPPPRRRRAILRRRGQRRQPARGRRRCWPSAGTRVDVRRQRPRGAGDARRAQLRRWSSWTARCPRWTATRRPRRSAAARAADAGACRSSR